MDNEQEVIAHAKNDPEAFGRLYDKYYQPVFGFLLNRTGNVEVAKDLCSETFFQALKAIGRYKDKGKPFKSWLFAIAVAQIGNYYRARSKMLSVTTDECPELVAADGYQPDVIAEGKEVDEEMQQLIARMKQSMKQLNQKQQTILALRYFSHMTVPEIAGTMNMKEGTVKSHIHRAIKKMQVLMSEDLKERDSERVFVEVSLDASKSYELTA